MPSLLRQTFAMLRGLLITGRYLFRPAVTIAYPEVKTKVQPRFKGRHWLTRYTDGLERCVGCELCVIVCPSQAIFVKAAENTPEHQVSKGERYAEDFQINMLRWREV
jgi:NADH-quinone oxidoreductase subunit I